MSAHAAPWLYQQLLQLSLVLSLLDYAVHIVTSSELNWTTSRKMPALSISVLQNTQQIILVCVRDRNQLPTVN